jgi:hypothetical protein
MSSSAERRQALWQSRRLVDPKQHALQSVHQYLLEQGDRNSVVDARTLARISAVNRRFRQAGARKRSDEAETMQKYIQSLKSVFEIYRALSDKLYEQNVLTAKYITMRRKKVPAEEWDEIYEKYYELFIVIRRLMTDQVENFNSIFDIRPSRYDD